MPRRSLSPRAPRGPAPRPFRPALEPRSPRNRPPPARPRAPSPALATGREPRLLVSDCVLTGSRGQHQVRRRQRGKRRRAPQSSRRLTRRALRMRSDSAAPPAGQEEPAHLSNPAPVQKRAQKDSQTVKNASIPVRRGSLYL